MKRNSVWILAACAVLACAGCNNAPNDGPGPIPVDSVTLDATTLTLEIGETEKVTVMVTPDNATYSVIWSSSDTEVATVSQDGYRYGVVAAVKVGTAIITAQAGDRTTTCEVTVKPISVKKITLIKNALMPTPGETEKLTAWLMPENAGDKTITWSSSNEAVATVDDDGTVTAIKEGTAIITAKAGDKMAECEVTVHQHSYSGGKCTVCGILLNWDEGTIDDNGVLTEYKGNAATVEIPDGVTGIGEGAFKECMSLESITIPDSVTSIGDWAFEGCTSLANITISDSVTSIGGWAFKECTSLASVTIGNGVTSIGQGAFKECTSLASVTIGNGVTIIWAWAFDGCTSLKSIEIPDSVTSIGWGAFDGCTSLESVTIGDGVTSIGKSAFDGCTSLESVTIGDSVTSIGNYAFQYCTKLASVTIPASVTSIGDGAFYNCTSLESVTIGDGVTSIGSNAFYGCSNLESVTIPASVTSIGIWAFKWCTSLKSVTYKGTKDEWDKIEISSSIFLNSAVKKIIGSDSTWTAQ